jgi:hypothetical protein
MLLKEWIKKVFERLTLVRFVRCFFLVFMLTATAVNLFYDDIIQMAVVKGFTIAQIVGLVLLVYVMGWSDGSGEE